MRKIIASINTTLDGFMAGPGGDLNWHLKYWNNQMCECLTEQLQEADTILLGRNTYYALASYWPEKVNDLLTANEDIVLTAIMNSYIKAVVSKTISTSCWQNTVYLKGPLAKEIEQLKKNPGKNIVILGSSQLVSTLTKLDLIDRYELWVHPVIINHGTSLFKLLGHHLQLQMMAIRQFNSGVVKITYAARYEDSILE